MRLVSLVRASAVALLPVLFACGSAETSEDDVQVGALASTTRYTTSRTQSPITPEMVKRWRRIADREPGRREDVFSKIGDSQTVNAGFMHCFSKSGVDWGGHTDPLRASAESSAKVDFADTLKLFLRTDKGKLTFDRESLSAKVGARTSFALGGPLTQEIDATQARFAVVLYGGNDIMDAPTGGIHTYAKNMFKIIDTLLSRGVIPIMTTNVPKPIRDVDIPSFGAAGADPWVPRYAAITRGIAQSRQVPLIDLEKELRKIPGFGVGSDNLHLFASSLGACNFTEAGLKAGVNTRNLLTFDALHRVRVAFQTGQSFDAETKLAGSGTASSPYVVDEITFTDYQTTTTVSDGSKLGNYKCPTSQGTVTRKGLGKERVYRVSLSQKDRIRAAVYSQGASDLDVYVLRESDKTCMGRSDKDVTLDLAAGSYLVVVDSEAETSAGDYLLTLNKEKM